MDAITLRNLLQGQAWTCQWRCPYLGEVNQVHKTDLALDIMDIDDLPRYLVCHGCHMHLGELILIRLVVHPTRPTHVRQQKRFTVHFWPDDPCVISGSVDLPFDGLSLNDAS